jgi:hypothetical protein
MSAAPSKPKLYNVTVRYKGLRALAIRIARAHKDVRKVSEVSAYAMAVDAMADFLAENECNAAIVLWLKGLVIALSDLDRGITAPVLRPAKAANKSLPTTEWRRFAAIAAGMRALTISGVSRDEAANHALRSVRSIRKTTKKVVLSRYDEFQKQGRVKNKAAAKAYANSCKLLDGQPPEKLREIAAQLFTIADLMP